MKNIYLLLLLLFCFSACSDKENKQRKENLSPKEILQKDAWTDLYSKDRIGNSFISNFKSSQNFDNRNRAIIEADNQNILLANHKGILSYNGEEWKMIKTPASVYSFAKDMKRIYVGCHNEFGYIEKDETLNYVFHSLKNETIFNDEIQNISIGNKIIVFGGEKNIFVYSKEDNELSKSYTNTDSTFYNGFFTHKGEVYTSIPEEGFAKISTKNLENLNTPKELKNQKIIFSANFDSTQTLIGINNQIWLFDGENFKKFNTKAEQYIADNILSEGINISKSEFGIATLTGGCVIVSKLNGEILNTINYQSGLPDDEVFALGKDRNKGLWIVHALGISRINYNFPIKNFDTYPGIEGKISSTIPFENTIYVGTSEGIFHLGQVNNYSEVESLIKGKQNKGDGNSFKSRWKRTKRIWGFGKNNASSEAKKRYALQSITHIYKKIDGLNAKCKQIIKAKNYLAIASNKGLFAITNKKLYSIIKDKYINCLYFSESKNKLFAGTDKGIIQLNLKSNTWSVAKSIDAVRENVASIFEDENDNLWLGCENKIIKLSANNNEYSLSKTYNFSGNFPEIVTVAKCSKGLCSYLSENCFIYNSEQDSFIIHNENIKSQFVFSNDKNVWQKHSEKWFCVTDTSQEKKEIAQYLGLFNNIKDCVSDENKNTWVVAKNNKVYKILLNEEKSKNNFNIHWQSVASQKGTFFDLDNLKFDHKNNSIEFKIAAPFYSKNTFTYYQYRIENLNENWSDWSNNGTIRFAYIPAGNYTMQIRAKNAIGSFSNEKTLDFSVSPPYWRTGWFYFLEVFLLASLMGISFLMNRSGKTSKLSETLTFVTIITILQTIAFLISPIKSQFAGLIGGAPIFGLLSNVALAYLLTPIGAWVKKWLQQSNEEDTLTFKEKLKAKKFRFLKLLVKTKNYFKKSA